MREQAPPRSSSFGTVEGLQLLAETSSWVAGWLILPVWLGLTGARAADFLLYALGAGLLLSFGLAMDRPMGFRHAGELAWFTGVCCSAVFLVGGAAFSIAAMFH
jgi:hypothetical protein